MSKVRQAPVKHGTISAVEDSVSRRPETIVSPSLERRRSRWNIPAIVPYGATAILTVLFLFYFLNLWNCDLRTPIDVPAGDYYMSSAIVKGVMQNGWYTTNPNLGAPHGLDFQDFPMAEGLHFIFYQIAGLLGISVALAINIHYILGYILIALTSLYVFRRFRLPLVPSIAASMLFAFMPHHYMRGEYHLMLSSYYVIPLTVLVILQVSQGQAFIEPTSSPSRFPYRLTREGAAAAIICAMTGSAGIYYAFFAAAFFGIAGLYAIARRPSWRQAITASLPIATLGAFLVLNVSPTLIYQMRHGANPEVGKRIPIEADIYGMKVTQLLLPITNHRLPSFARMKAQYLAATSPYLPNNDLTVTLGAITSIGFLFLIAWLLWGNEARRDGQILTPLSILNVSAVLIATLGGFGSLFAFGISPQIRCYHRISIYISFFALLALLIALQKSQALWFGSGFRARTFYLASGVIMFAGLWDLTPAAWANRAAIQNAFASDRDFIRSIENAVPRASMIYQMPYFPFPESPPAGGMVDYDPLRAYLHSDHLRWSYGAMKGRPADSWQKAIATKTGSELLTILASAGFRGIYIDRFGYADRAVDLSGKLASLLAVQALESRDKRFVFFSMEKYIAEHRKQASPEEWSRLQRESTKLPLGISFSGCSGLESSPAQNWRWCAYDGEIQISNPDVQPHEVSLRMNVKSGFPEYADFDMEGPISKKLQINHLGQDIVENLVVPPGRHSIRLHCNAKRIESKTDPRPLVFAIMNLGIIDK